MGIKNKEKYLNKKYDFIPDGCLYCMASHSGNRHVFCSWCEYDYDDYDYCGYNCQCWQPVIEDVSIQAKVIAKYLVDKILKTISVDDATKITILTDILHEYKCYPDAYKKDAIEMWDCLSDLERADLFATTFGSATNE